MIRTISIQGYKSFPTDRPEVVSFEPTKRIALFYGLNGAGKSAIGEVIQANSSPETAIAGCTITLSRQDPVEFLVYNERFIEANFRSRPSVPGIFTIGKPDTDALKQAEALEVQSNELRERQQALAQERSVREDDRRLSYDAAANATWSAYTDHKDGPLKEWLGGYGGSKKKLFDALTGYPLPQTQALPTIEELSARMDVVSDITATSKSMLSVATEGLSEIEASPLWSKPIVGSSDSRLAPIIQQLENIDWVKKGCDFIEHGKDACPFCQQTLPLDFREQVSRLFDASYEKGVAEVNALSNFYDQKVLALRTVIERFIEEEQFAQEGALRQAFSEALVVLGENASQMQAKTRSPSDTVSVSPSADVLRGLVDAVQSTNASISEYNERIRDRDGERERIRKAFWLRLRLEHDGAINTYTVAQQAIDAGIAQTDATLAQVGRELTGIESELTRLRSTTSGTDRAVEAINQRLMGLGIDSFRIKKQDDDSNLYCLDRPGKGRSEYQSLSEGEKTLITFLYFVELINGSAVADRTLPLNRKIVVIDDPISSLSHNYVYDVASLIVHHVIGLADESGVQLKQVIVLTHSLFFHHELLLAGNFKERHVDLKRVLKVEHSSVVGLKQDDLLNDYDAFWLVVRDAKEGIGSRATVANAMRCILEHYFGFTRRRGDFQSVLRSMSDEDHSFVPLARYLNRQSHSNEVNRTDFGDYDLSYFLDKFEQVFLTANEMEHFRAMMRVEAEVADEGGVAS